MKELSQVPMQDTIATLRPESASLVELIKKGSKDMFGKSGKVAPCYFFLGEDGQVSVQEVTFRNDEEKDLVANKMRLIRQSVTIAAFVTEAWMGSYAKETSMEDINSGNYTRPSKLPGRKEVVLITLWEGKRTVVFYAEIMRKPKDALSAWYTMIDSNFPLGPEGKGEIEGRMVDGHAKALDDN